MSKITFDTTRLKEQAEDNPLLAAGVLAAVLTGAAKLLTSVTAAQNARTWKREVKRREKKTK